LLFFESICQGYHSFHYRDKLRKYFAARDALCSIAVLASLSGNDELSKTLQDEPLSSVSALIRSMEKKEKKNGDNG